MTTAARRRTAAPPAPQPVPTSQPLYELRVVVPKRGDHRIEIWQLPSPATPRLTAPEQVAGVKGRAWRLVETRVLRRLARAGVTFPALSPGTRLSWPVTEELALGLGLLFRALAPMRNPDSMREVADGIEAMSQEEAGYWLGMALHRQRPRRVLAALRMLLTTP